MFALSHHPPHCAQVGGDALQADRFVLNLDDSGVDVDKLSQEFTDWPMEGLEEIAAIKNGRIFYIWPPQS